MIKLNNMNASIHDSNEKPSEIKIFGLRRTGTNYLSKLLNINYNVKMIGGLAGWKHGKYRVKETWGREIDCIVISKNIYSWMSSLQKRYNEWNFYKIVESADFIQMYSFAYGDWLNIPEKLEVKKCLFVKYEDLIINPSLICEKISKQFKLRNKTKNFINIQKVVKPREILGVKNFNKSYYINREYMKKYNEELKILIKKHIDLNIVESLGYSKDTLI